jgi:putative intracellular protease/amidase
VDAIRIAKEGAAEGKILATISGGVFTLVKADLLKGKKIAEHLLDFWLQKAGATMSAAPVERDGLIITAAGPSESQNFLETVAVALTSEVN